MDLLNWNMDEIILVYTVEKMDFESVSAKEFGYRWIKLWDIGNGMSYCQMVAVSL